MGIRNDPVEFPPEYGMNCTTAFPAGESPLYLYAIIQGIQTCPSAPPTVPDPPNGVFRIRNLGGCRWWGLIQGFWIEVRFRPTETQLWITDTFTVQDYFSVTESGVVFEFQQSEASCLSGNYYGGSVELLTEAKQFNFSWGMNFVPFSKAWVDDFNESSAVYTQRLVSKQDKTNVLAKLEINE